MAEETTEKKVEVDYVANEDAQDKYPNDSRIVVNVGKGQGAKIKYEIYLPVPSTDEEAKEYFGEKCDLKLLIEKGVRSLSTGPNWQQFFNEDGTMTPAQHNEAQALADSIEVGRKAAVGGSIKAQAKKMKELEGDLAEAGMDMAELKELLRKAKEAKGN